MSNTLTTHTLKVPPADLDALRTVARIESVRLGRDVTWGDLVRDAMRWMAENRRPVNT